MWVNLRNRSRVIAVFLCCTACDGSIDQDPGTDGMQGGIGGLGAAGSASQAGSAGLLAAGSGAGASGTAAAGTGGRAGGASGSSGAAGTAAGSSASGTGGVPASGTGGDPAAGSGGAAGQVAIPTERFSFFVTSLEAMVELSGSEQGFGGDLRFGEATGLAGADKICATIADMSLAGASGKQWHAFLSAAEAGPGGGPVHARDRIGEGPWYDRMGRLVAMDLEALLQERPEGADALIADDLPNEHGEPNHQGVDNHDTITASDENGEYDGGETCDDWTNAPALDPGMLGGGGRGGGGTNNGPGLGHSWPAGSGMSWISAHNARGCAAGVNLVQNGGGMGNGIGAGGGYGGLYCFALMP
jgi:hypothetical protein